MKGTISTPTYVGNKRPRLISLSSLIVFVILLFCIIIVLLYQHLYQHQLESLQLNHNSSNKRFEGRFPYHRLTDDKFDLLSINTNISYLNIPLKRQFLWIIREKAGISLQPSFDIDERTFYLPYGTLVYGNKYSIKNGMEGKKVYLFLEYPYKGWIEITESDVTALSLPSSTLQYPAVQNKSVKPTCSNSSLINYDMDYPGGDLQGGGRVSNPVKVESFTQCCEECLKDRQCNHWAFTKGQDCWLKLFPDSAAGRPNSGIISGKLPTKQQRNDPLSAMSTESVYSCKQKPLRPTLEKELIPTVSTLSYPLIEKNRLLPASSFALRSMALTGNWDEQWLIGNGKFGGFIHGNIQYEVNPFSIHNFFLLKPKPPPPPHAPKESNEEQLPNTFAQARKEYLTGHFQKSDKILSTFQKAHDLGMFQYLFDISLLFSQFPLQYQTSSPPQPQNPVGQPQLRKRNPDFMSYMIFHGRRNRIERIRHFIQQIFPSSSRGHPEQKNNHKDSTIPNPNPNLNTAARPFHPFNHVLLSESNLDLSTGITSAMYIHRRYFKNLDRNSVKGDGNNITIEYNDEYHYREWFASAVDKVAMGRYQCKPLHPHNTGTGEGCLNVALEISREIPIEPDRIIYQLLTVQTGKEYLEKNSNLQMEEDISPKNSYILQYSLKAFGENIIPTTSIWILLTCDGEDFNYYEASTSTAKKPNAPSDSVNIFICNRASTLSIRMTADKVDNLGKTRNELITINEQEGNRLVKKSKQAFHRILKKGFDKIREDHIKDFKQQMKSVLFEFQKSKNDRSGKYKMNGEDPVEEICSHLPSNLYYFQGFGKSHEQLLASKPISSPGGPPAGPAFPHENEKDMKGMKIEDYQLMTQMYQYGRYLLLSSARGSVTNLQGLWSDGLSSAWNGDYHLNINLQMNYWAIFPSQFKESFFPLADFITRLAKQGSTTAEQMYNIQAITDSERNTIQPWVSHGFTDSSLHSHPNGDNQWSLCVTCGAWLANHLTDLFLYESMDNLDNTVIKEQILPVFRGMIAFYQQYLFKSTDPASSLVHTGPTTSPENSYLLVMDHLEKGFHSETIEILSLSPAIDISILRQVSNGFSFLMTSLSLAGKEKQSLISADDIQLAKSFEDLIANLPNHAVPVVEQLSSAPFTLIKEFPDNYIEIEVSSSVEAKGDQEKQNLQVSEKENSNHKPGQLSEPIPLEEPPVRPALPILPPKVPPPEHRQPKGPKLIVIPPNIPKELADQLEHMNQIQLMNFQQSQLRDDDGQALKEEPVVPNKNKQRKLSSEETSSLIVRTIEDIDYGHRHFSILHWLYPNPFLPFLHSPNTEQKSDPFSDTANSAENSDIYLAAWRTLLNKYQHKGGHTNWSLIWQLCLLARLPNYDEISSSSLSSNKEKEIPIHELVYLLFQKFFSSYLTNNYLTVHPVLQKNPMITSSLAAIPLSPTTSHHRKLEEINFPPPRLPNGKFTPKLLPKRGVPQGNNNIGKSYPCETCFQETISDPSSKLNEITSIYEFYFRYQQCTELDPSEIELEIDPTSSTVHSNQNNLDRLLGQFLPEKGFQTKFEEKFQIDANFGYLAAIHELLVQSFIPNTIHLFPISSLFFFKSPINSLQGRLEGMALAGNSQIVLLEWFTHDAQSEDGFIRQGIRVVILQIDLAHLWWRKDGFIEKSKEKKSGFYGINQNARDNNVEIIILTPTQLAVVIKEERDFYRTILRTKHIFNPIFCDPTSLKYRPPDNKEDHQHRSYVSTVSKDKHQLTLQFNAATAKDPQHSKCILILNPSS